MTGRRYWVYNALRNILLVNNHSLERLVTVIRSEVRFRHDKECASFRALVSGSMIKIYLFCKNRVSADRCRTGDILTHHLHSLMLITVQIDSVGYTVSGDRDPEKRKMEESREEGGEHHIPSTYTVFLLHQVGQGTRDVDSGPGWTGFPRQVT